MKTERSVQTTGATSATVIGGTGFIGSALTLYLQSRGWQCWVPNRRQEWPSIGRPLGHVFYCAGLTVDYLQHPADTAEAHIGLLSRVLKSDNFESLVYLSSTRVYDDRVGANAGQEPGPFALSPENLRHFYDLTKLTGEAICMALGHGKARVARLSCVYRDSEDPDGFIAHLLQQVKNSARGETIHVDSSPAFSRDYVHIDNVLTAMVAIAVQGSQPVYNVASGSNLSNRELAKLIQDFSGRKIHFLKDTPAPPSTVVDISRLRDDFGLIPEPTETRLISWLSSLDC